MFADGKSTQRTSRRLSPIELRSSTVLAVSMSVRDAVVTTLAVSFEVLRFSFGASWPPRCCERRTSSSQVKSAPPYTSVGVVCGRGVPDTFRQGPIAFRTSSEAPRSGL